MLWDCVAMSMNKRRKAVLSFTGPSEAHQISPRSFAFDELYDLAVRLRDVCVRHLASLSFPEHPMPATAAAGGRAS